MRYFVRNLHIGLVILILKIASLLISKKIKIPFPIDNPRNFYYDLWLEDLKQMKNFKIKQLVFCLQRIPDALLITFNFYKKSEGKGDFCCNKSNRF